ncbi:adhesion G-protein coupled receptor G6 isoform X7 [Cyprinodon tularosa]|uniref:adhesion G-protein coupled receptor G6 isoform X7 n=1 Tax=Cyprinodon tularosa TaxID=77115 RepID=UPI0018E27366|nr:adhesion G-protein coupled receptor G6 isoform X7 [Cyprinodon tularosa]
MGFLLLEGGGRWRLRHVILLVLLWMFLHRTAPVLGCSSINCNVVLTEARGEIKSPCYPEKYPNTHTCKWTLQAPAGFIIQLSFLDFELEEAPNCMYDRVLVNTGNAESKFCGLTASGLTLNSTRNEMELSFISDFSIQKRGFMVSFQHVAVALRNQKVKIPSAEVAEVANSVYIPSLNELTICLEVERLDVIQEGWLFTYYDVNNNVALSFGSSQSGMKIFIDGVDCIVESVIPTSYITSSMKPFCVLWTSSDGRVATYFNGMSQEMTCQPTIGRTVPVGGVFKLGGVPSFKGNIYNLRLWNRTLTQQDLESLTCTTVGNVIDWDNSQWVIVPSLPQTDNTLSCSSTPLTGCEAGGPSCSDSLFYRVSFTVNSELNQKVEECEKLLNWSHSAAEVRLQQNGGSNSYTCLVLLMTSKSLGEQELSAQLYNNLAASSFQDQIGDISVKVIENCPKDNHLSYLWPETSPRVTQYLPCFPTKDQSISRTCLINPETFASYWSTANLTNCTVTADNAAGVAEQLADLTKNNLTSEEVSQVVTKVHELVSVAKINTTVAESVVNIISNVMVSSKETPGNTSNIALRAMEELAKKLEFDGPSVNITSKHLALGILALNASLFNETSFSTVFLPNSNDPKIEFDRTTNPLAQVTLPSSLLTGVSSGDFDRSSLSRINFMFFSNPNLFMTEQKGWSLNSYVVASSVGNLSIQGLKDPVRIEITHLFDQVPSNRECVFWDFSMHMGDGGWNKQGCVVSEESNTSRTVCLCNHLTHFGILMDISQSSSRMDPENKRVLTFLSYVGCGISAICSAATLLTYIAFEKLRRDYPSKILMNLSTSLLCLNIVFLLDGWLATMVKNEGLCTSAAVLLHYFLLTSFTWMGLESVHMYIALVKVFNTYIRRYILKFCIVGWGLPAVLVGIVVTVNKNHYGILMDREDETAIICWIKNKSVFYTTCVGYFCLMFLLNVAMFIVVMMQICGRNGKRSNRTLREEVLRNLRSVVSLTFLLGMTWGFALFAWGPVYLTFTYLFTIFNSLQGLFIFIFHCALKENVQKQWRRYLCCGPYRLSENSDWSKTATNNTKKVSSDNLAKSLSSSSFGSSTISWTSKAKATLTPFNKRNRNADKRSSNQSSPKCVSSSSSSSEVEPNSCSSSSSILPVSQMIDKVKDYCSTRTDNFYKNIIMSDSFTNCTRL